jgi:EAL domain-containing protein (putative c-di-GMP-specific phosphodiesterase class I)
VHLADHRMLELVADQLAAEPDARISLNVSPLTLDRPDWLPALAGQLGMRGGISNRLIVEVTETAAVRDPDGMRRTLEAMRSLGVSIAIDDFGAGHTSFRHMRDFPVDMVKLDGAFVQNLSRSADDRFFVRTLIELARHLGLQTVGEWVEDEESAMLLAAWGADYLQGDHCGRPELVRAAASESPPEGGRTSLVA